MKPYFAILAASVLRRATLAEVRPSAGERAAAIARIEQALRAKAARRRRWRWATAAVALTGTAAAGLALHLRSPAPSAESSPAVTAVVSPTGAGARVFTASGALPVQGGAALLPGSRLIAAAAGGASVQLSTGTEIEVHPNASLQFSEAGPVERFMLARGDMLARVAKLRKGERFIVSTPDAEVEVHGTVFRVAVVEADADCAAGNQTRVEVLEGIVEVRANGTVSHVRPGQHWPASCGLPASLAQSLAAKPSDRTEPSDRAPLSKAEPNHPSRPRRLHDAQLAPASPDEESSTKLQNELFSQAVEARRAGDSAAAIAKFQNIAEQYPKSPLAEGAAAERMRLLAVSDPGAAQRAARAYLARYPRGFATSDAHAILKSR